VVVLGTASTEPDKERLDEITKEDRRVTLDAIATKLGIRHNAVQEMIGSLGYQKIVFVGYHVY
jgi:predicted ArsR family transcriptional regulator